MRDWRRRASNAVPSLRLNDIDITLPPGANDVTKKTIEAAIASYSKTVDRLFTELLLAVIELSEFHFSNSPPSKNIKESILKIVPQFSTDE